MTALEVGKTYIARDGSKVKIIRDSPTKFYRYTGDNGSTYTLLGSYLTSDATPHRKNLIKEEKTMNLQDQYNKAEKELKRLGTLIEEDNRPKVGAYGVNSEGATSILVQGSTLGHFESCDSIGNQAKGWHDWNSSRKVGEALDVWIELCMCDGAREHDASATHNWFIAEHQAYAGEFTTRPCSGNRRISPFTVYFSSRDQAWAAIDTLGDTKLRQLFMLT